MPSSNLKKTIPLLETLSKIKDAKKRRTFLNLFESNIRRALQEVSYNLLEGNIRVSDEDKKRLRRYRRALRELADSKTKRRRFQKLIVQSGRGLIPGLIALVSTIVANAL